MATWSVCNDVDGKIRPIYINLDNVLTLQQGEGIVTTVVMVGGQTIHVETPPEEVIKPKKPKKRKG